MRSGREMSVVVITRNRCRELARTLDRLAVDSPEVEVLVVDNASSDGTPALLRERHDALRAIRCRRNLGATARNVGVDAADSRFVAFADDDSWWAPGALARAARLLDDFPGVGLLAGKVVVEPAGSIDPASTKMGRALLGRGLDLPGPPILGFLACSAVVRREAYRSVGGFSRILQFGGEEQLLAMDLAGAGWGVCYVDSVVAHHHPSASRSPWPRRWARYRRNDVLTAWLRRPLRVAAADSAGLVSQAVREPALRRVVLEVAVRLPAALAQRRPLPAEIEAQLAP